MYSSAFTHISKKDNYVISYGMVRKSDNINYNTVAKTKHKSYTLL